jgi:SAM-dependent methyltransferase
MNVLSPGTILETAGPSPIRTTAAPACPLCGGDGEFLYRNQRDRLFGADGVWNSKRCVDVECGLVWLDPMPLKDEIGKAYARYYTHAPSSANGKRSLPGRFRDLADRGYWASQYHYEIGPRPFIARLLGGLLRLSPVYRREADARVRCLPALKGGRLLDVGCGAGDWLLAMQQRGWQVEGVDFDENAVRVAARRGLQVFSAALEQRRFPESTFDAVTLSHVIEHVPDPVQTLTECARILKPGGKLVLFTPNNTSLTHLLFKENWRGLEPPRHLHVFSMPSMRRALTLAGFPRATIHPFVVTSIIYESALLRQGWAGPGKDPRPRRFLALSARCFKLLESLAIRWNSALGDCLIAVAEKE